MARRGKRYNQMAATFDKYGSYPPSEAIRMVKTMARARFDETVEAVLKLGIDPRRADQLVRGTVVLPHGTGKSVRVAVFAGGDKQLEAEQAGAEVVGGQDLVDMPASGGEIAFDVATTEMLTLEGPYHTPPQHDVAAIASAIAEFARPGPDSTV